MKTQKTIRALVLLSQLAVAPAALAADSAQDADVIVDPTVHVFTRTAAGAYSAAMTFTVTNKNGAATRTLGSVSLSGPNADQFLVQNDTCSGATLTTNGSCTIGVRFHPTGSGTKAANLLIPSNDAETPVLTAHVTNHEPAPDQARRRMPPVLSSVSIPETMTAGATYTITWSLEGYHDDYMSMAVLFDCTGITDGTCGAAYSDASRFAESGSMAWTSRITGDWTYSGFADKRFDYTWAFTVPAKRKDGSDWDPAGTNIVVRFYSKDNVDLARNNASVSLLIPGNQASRYYDTAGRRFVKTIKP